MASENPDPPAVPARRRSTGTSGPGPRRYRLTPGLGLWLALKAAALVLLVRHHVGSGLAVFFLWDPWLIWNILTPTARGFGPVITRFATERREVWLTIDDGPDPLTTPRILDLLDAHGARATFFVIGEQVRRHAALAAEIVRRGHQLGNHTSSHGCGSFWMAGPARIGREIDACASAMEQAARGSTRYFRPPVGIKTPFLHPQLARRGLSLVAWSARGYDSLLSTSLAVRRIVAGIRPGAIVLLHDGRRDIGRVAVVERVLDHLTRTGYRAVIPPDAALVR